MERIDATVKRETLYIAFWVGLLSLILQAVFLVIGKWDISVLLGNLLGGLLAVLNFFLLGLTVQKAVKKEEKQAKNIMSISQTLRSVMQFSVAAVGVLLPIFNTWAVLIPLFFPRIAIMLRPLIFKNEK